MIRPAKLSGERSSGVVSLARAAVTVLALLSGSAAAATIPPQAPPPYDDQLLRLSEILGTLHYLRDLCSAGEGSLWRDQMQALIDGEEPDASRRARFVDRFNRGYESYRSVYRSCTPAATETIDRYMDEGAKIAHDVTTRYGR